MTANAVAGTRETFAIHPELDAWLKQTISASRLSIRAIFDFYGEEHVYEGGGKDSSPSAVLKVAVSGPGVVRQLIEQKDPLVAVEALLNGTVSFVGRVDDAVSLYCWVASHEFAPSADVMEWCGKLQNPPPSGEQQSDWTTLRAHSTERDRAVVRAHYDLSNEFYRLWLDPLMVYTCAHFEHSDMTLADAQEAKLDLICRKLRLKPGEKLLDIGCGWGGLLRWAATRYGATAHGITISQEQIEYDRQWIAEEGLTDRVIVDLLDYRDLPPSQTYDKIASIGMIEHVGLRNYSTYFRAALSALKPGGLFLNQGIATHEHFKPGIDFIARYIFPDGQCAQLYTYLKAAQESGWEIVDVEAWRPHYAKTLRCWAANLEAAGQTAQALVGGRRYLLWQLYLTLCAQGFERGRTGIYQVLMRRAEDADWNLPLVRNGWLY